MKKILRFMGGLVLAVVSTTVLLNIAYPDKTNLPDHYRYERPLHDDWKINGLPDAIQPWTKIPRSWTSFPEIPMPPRKWAGTQEEDCIRIQPMYSLSADVQFCPDGRMVGIHPVGPVGTWSIQSAYIAGSRVPVYFTASPRVLDRRLHINFGLKPDVTVQDTPGKKGDQDWNFPEMSVTLRKLK